MKDTDIKTIIFDLGGVYFTPGTSLAINKIIDSYDISKNETTKLKQFFSDNPGTEGFLLRRGLMTMEEFEEKLFLKFNLQNKNKKHIRYIWFGSYAPHYGMEDLIKNLKKTYRLVIFSGNVRERVQFLNDRYNFLKYFDETVFSFDYQLNKDDTEFYQELLNHIECQPNQAIVVDDEKKNIKRAKQIGLNGIYFFYTEQLIEELKSYNVKII